MTHDSFRIGMRKLASGVAVVCTRLGGRRYGLVATSVTSLSAEPPSLLVCINRSASAHDAMDSAGSFCVNLLTRDQQDVARNFAAPSARDKRFDGHDWTSLATGAPALKDALCSFDCEVVERIGYHSHTIFLARVVEVELWPEQANSPLVYLEGTYRAISAPGSEGHVA